MTKRKQPVQTVASLSRASLTLREVVVGACILVPLIISGALTYWTMTADVAALKADIKEVHDHQRASFKTLNRIMSHLGMETEQEKK